MASQEPSTDTITIPLPQPKPATSLVSEMLIPSEIELLRQKDGEDIAYLQEVYPGVKIHR